MRLAVYCDGNFVITLPQGVNRITAEKYIIKKSKWVISKLDFFKNTSLPKAFKFTKKDFIKYKEKALEITKDRIEHFNKIYKYKFNSIVIKNQKTRWGSCSKKKNLNFNFKLALLPSSLRDYVIVHELCHLKEFNHSKKFWSLVNRTIPNHKKIISDLKLEGLNLQ
ncbi:M48 family metallopeptidase [Patescibacteria group bacterium]|nr:M48 family metallopeptidase [Patescibacteria group bacterium]